MYLLEKEEEFSRLEYQAKQKNYLIQDELSDFPLRDFERILDAGCGSGLGMRYLSEINPTSIIDGVDISSHRVEEANRFFDQLQFDNLNASQDSLYSLNLQSNQYDFIYSRYVFQHLIEPQKAIEELYRVAKVGGTVAVIDFDGPIFNLQTSNQELVKILGQIKKEVPFNGYIGRQLKSLFVKAGFKNINCKADAIVFNTEDEIFVEHELVKDRLLNAKESIEHYLGEFTTRRFIDLYLEEMLNPESFLYYTKFVVSGEK